MNRHRGTARAAGLLLGWLVDRRFGDPRRGHPVAGFGQVATAVERGSYADARARGVLHLIVLLAPVVALGAGVERAARRHWIGEVVTVAAATWVVLGARSLTAEADAMADRLAADDLPGARRRLSHLCSRDAATLTGPELARATVESVAENTSDAVVAPLLWGAVAGVPGLLGYRVINTLDAMIGYRNDRYVRFGWAAARTDDLVNLLPARVCAALTALVGGRPAAAWRVWRRDAAAHPSPNAGPVEAAFAGSLGVRLGGSNAYGGHVEQRGVLDGGRDVIVDDVAAAARLSVRVGGVAAVVAAVVSIMINSYGWRS